MVICPLGAMLCDCRLKRKQRQREKHGQKKEEGEEERKEDDGEEERKEKDGSSGSEAEEPHFVIGGR